MGLEAKVDGGYSWIVFISVFIIVSISDGIPISFGVLLPFVQEKYHCTTAAAAALGSFTNGGHYIMGVFYSALIPILGCRLVGIIGKVFSAVLALKIYLNLLRCSSLGFELIFVRVRPT